MMLAQFNGPVRDNMVSRKEISNFRNIGLKSLIFRNEEVIQLPGILISLDFDLLLLLVHR